MRRQEIRSYPKDVPSPECKVRQLVGGENYSRTPHIKDYRELEILVRQQAKFEGGEPMFHVLGEQGDPEHADLHDHEVCN